MNEANKSYADAGNNIQCFHTPDSIHEDLKKSWLNEPAKVHYPWDLARRFDYGYFPGAKEEIWDWFIVAERALDVGN